MNNRISGQAGVCGWLAYTPPAEVGQGSEVRAYGTGGFSIWLSSNNGGYGVPRARRTPARPLTIDQARAVARDVDRYISFDRDETCAGWVEAVIADLPVALQEAIDIAKKRTRELRALMDEAEDACEARGPGFNDAPDTPDISF